jgi:hypothetical protein
LSAVVSDSSPLNYLALFSDFDLLRRMYGTLVIPPAVYREVVESGVAYPVATAVQMALGKWIGGAGGAWPSISVIAICAKGRIRRFRIRPHPAVYWRNGDHSRGARRSLA